MIQQIQRYEGLGRPEERRNIDLTNDPTQIILNTYQLWLPIFDRSGMTHIDPVGRESAYQEAALLLKPHAKAFENVDSKDLDNVVSEIIKYRYGRGVGLFLSAMLNATELKDLESNYGYSMNFLGYKLSSEKRLVVNDSYQNGELGYNAQGGEIINYSGVWDIATNAEAGIQLNFGVANSMSNNVSGGIQLNFNILHSFGQKVEEGIQVNYGTVNMMASEVIGGLQVNLGHVRNNMAFCSEGGLQVNLGSTTFGIGWNAIGGFQVDLEDLKYKSIMDRNHTVTDDAKPLLKSLEAKLKEIEHLKELSQDEALKSIRSYDWKEFEEEVLSLKVQIEEALR